MNTERLIFDEKLDVCHFLVDGGIPKLLAPDGIHKFVDEFWFIAYYRIIIVTMKGQGNGVVKSLSAAVKTVAPNRRPSDVMDSLLPFHIMLPCSWPTEYSILNIS